MADRQFNPLGNESAPADWTLPANLQLLLKNVYASFNGTGAAGSYQPCLEIISDSGHTVGSYTGSTVAAGGSADVTWFPRLGGSTSTTSTGTFVRAYGTNINQQTVTAGTSSYSSFATSAQTSDSTQVSWSSSTATNDTLTLHGVGWALLLASCRWTAGTKVDYRVFSPNGYDFLHDGFGGMSERDPTASFNKASLMDTCWIDTTAASTTPLHVRMTNSDGADSGPSIAHVACMFWPGLSV